MRVSCPACDTTYDVPDRLIGAGRRLRCARCDHDWMVRPPPGTEPAPQAEPAVGTESPTGLAAGAAEAAPLPAPPSRPKRASRAPAGVLGLWLAWVASVGAVGLAVAGLWLFRVELSLAWPPIQRLYALLG